MFGQIKEAIEKIAAAYGSDPVGAVKESLYYYARYRLFKDLVILIFGGIGLLLPTCTLWQLKQSNTIMQRQTQWLINNDVNENYQRQIDRLQDADTYDQRQRQLSLDQLEALTTEFPDYSMSDLDLSGLSLPSSASEVSISDSRFSGSLFSRRAEDDYDIYRSTFSGSTIGEIRMLGETESCTGHTLSHVDIMDATFSDSAILCSRFDDSHLSGSFTDSRIWHVNFCRTYVSFHLQGSRVEDVSFNCHDMPDFLKGWVGAFIYLMMKDTRLFSSLGSTDFEGSQLVRVDFSDADLSGTRNLDKAEAIDVCGNERTEWPAGISYPNCSDTEK